MTAQTEPQDAAAAQERDTIVVGHDGSKESDQALTEAMSLARALGAQVLVVRAWSLATAPRPADWEFGYVPGFEEYAEAVHRGLVRDVQPTFEKFPEVRTECRAAHDSAAKSLVELSQGARLLVVGARGLGGLSGMLLGSVSEQCVRHAGCSVLVARTQH